MAGQVGAADLIGAIRNSDTATLKCRSLKQLVEGVNGDAALASDVVNANGIEQILDAADGETLEVAMSCMCALLRYDMAVDWLASHESLIGTGLYRRCFTALFYTPDPDAAACSFKPGTFMACVELLLALPSMARAAHEAAQHRPDGGHTLYAYMLDVLAPGATSDVDLAGAARVLMCAIVEAASQSPDSLLLDKVLHVVRQQSVASTDSAQIAEVLEDKVSRTEVINEELRRGYMALASGAVPSLDACLLKEENAQLHKELQTMAEDRRRLQLELRRVAEQHGGGNPAALAARPARMARLAVDLEP